MQVLGPYGRAYEPTGHLRDTSGLHEIAACGRGFWRSLTINLTIKSLEGTRLRFLLHWSVPFRTYGLMLERKQTLLQDKFKCPPMVGVKRT
jgi:hypothetical protein